MGDVRRMYSVKYRLNGGQSMGEKQRMDGLWRVVMAEPSQAHNRLVTWW
jgi:hypothetical protein